MERVEAVIARQLYGKHVFAARDTDAKIEDAVFSTWPLLGNGAVNPFQERLISKKQ
jgi:hypothetical protein